MTTLNKYRAKDSFGKVAFCVAFDSKQARKELSSLLDGDVISLSIVDNFLSVNKSKSFVF